MTYFNDNMVFKIRNLDKHEQRERVVRKNL